MKKIYIPILLAASLYSANAVEPDVYTGQLPCQAKDHCDHRLLYGMPDWLTVYGDDLGVSSHTCAPHNDYFAFKEGNAGYGTPYTIHNNTGKKIKGFKFHHYFNAQPSGKFKVKVYHYFHSNRVDRGAIYRDESIQPDSIKIQRLSAIQYRAILYYKNVVIPSGTRFPEEGAFYVRIASNEKVNGKKVPVTGWAKEGHQLQGFVITDPSGTVLYGPKLNKTGKKKYPSIDKSRRVGVLSKYDTCPGYYTEDSYYNDSDPHPKRDTLTITLDAENTNPETWVEDKDGNKLGNNKIVGVTVANTSKRVKFKYCAIDTVALPQARYDYAVLSLDSLCPEGSYRFARLHDTEDNENANASTGQIWPNDVKYEGKDAKLYYCFVPKKSSASNIHPFVDAGFAVFGKRTDSFVDYLKIRIDDEDTNNNSSWSWFDAPSDIKSSIRTFMRSDTNFTWYHVIQQKDALSRSAAEVAESPISADQPLVVAAPLAPAIKGLDRSAVAVELKSEGKVKVSIVNVNGSVIANIAQESLQPGIHQIKWNSGMVPSGRYIVKIEQNGMVNAKNVILK